MTKVTKYAKPVKKRTKKFIGHQNDRFKRVKPSWRKPKGIDSRVRRRFRDNRKLPNIGYRNKKTHRFLLPNNKYKFTVCNPADVDVLLMSKHSHCVEIGRQVGSKKRKIIIEKCDKLGLICINRKARLETEEQEQCFISSCF